MSCRLGSPTMNFFKGSLTILSPLTFHWLPFWNQASPPNFNIFSRICSLNSIKATVSQVDKHKHQHTLKKIWSHGWQLPLGHAQHLKNTLKQQNKSDHWNNCLLSPIPLLEYFSNKSYFLRTTCIWQSKPLRRSPTTDPKGECYMGVKNIQKQNRENNKLCQFP